MDEKELKKKLTPEQYRILREKGTEKPFSGKYYDSDDEGTYTCVACGNELFTSDAKFTTTIDGLRGWPSFEDAISGSVEFRADDADGMYRTGSDMCTVQVTPWSHL